MKTKSSFLLLLLLAVTTQSYTENAFDFKGKVRYAWAGMEHEDLSATVVHLLLECYHLGILDRLSSEDAIFNALREFTVDGASFACTKLVTQVQGLSQDKQIRYATVLATIIEAEKYKLRKAGALL